MKMIKILQLALLRELGCCFARARARSLGQRPDTQQIPGELQVTAAPRLGAGAADAALRKARLRIEGIAGRRGG